MGEVDGRFLGGLSGPGEVEDAMKHPNVVWFRQWRWHHPWLSVVEWFRWLAYRWRTRKCPPPW